MINNAEKTVGVIVINEDKKTLTAGADPRRESYIQGW